MQLRRETYFTFNFDIDSGHNENEDSDEEGSEEEPLVIALEVAIADSFKDSKSGRGRRELFNCSTGSGCTIFDVDPSQQYFVKVRKSFWGGWTAWSKVLKIPDFRGKIDFNFS